jgi:uncharacterized protein YbjT (DUF2867 family)
VLVQPIDVGDVAAALVEVASGPREDALIEVAGPDQHDLVDMARRTLTTRGESLRLTTGWREPFGVDWLARQ